MPPHARAGQQSAFADFQCCGVNVIRHFEQRFVPCVSVGIEQRHFRRDGLRTLHADRTGVHVQLAHCVRAARLMRVAA